jgi:60 kDa SS-A/Ro ribonucleoprotein
MVDYVKHFKALFTDQREAAHPAQVPNSAGGYTFALGPWERLDRWLVLGAEGGSYYATERALTIENAKSVAACVALDGPRAVARVVDMSASGRAPKNAPAIFALALAAGAEDVVTRKAALAALPLVARTGTDLFHFARAVGGFRKWGRALRTAVAAWYVEKPVEALAYQVVKYQQRDGWSHRDLLRLAHPRAKSVEHDALFRWVTGGVDALAKQTDKGKPIAVDKLPALIKAFEGLRAATSKREVVELVRAHRFTHEMLLTEWKNDADVWAALLDHMPVTAMIRSLAKMTAVGLLAPLARATKHVVRELGDGARLAKARVHPIALLSALKVYEQGHGERGKLSWTPVREIVDALDAAFYAAFRAAKTTNKSHLLALDVSGSMTCGAIAGVPGLTPRVASAAMALVTAKVEEQFSAVAFSTTLTPLGISPRQRLDDVLKVVESLPFGGTDCAQPMLWATANRVPVDTFVIYTDSETWAGAVHPHQALEQYRQKLGRAAKLVVVGMTSTGFSIANPDDAGMMDVVGFDAAAPQVMADFSRA